MAIFSSEESKLATNVLDQDEYVRFFQGTRNAQLFTLALFTWFAYEYIATFINEVVFFWADREWTRGRALFFVNRYTTWLVMIPSLYGNARLSKSDKLLTDPSSARSGGSSCFSPESIPCAGYVPRAHVVRCTRSIYVLLVTNVICIAIGQAYLSNKFWNIFERRRPIQISLLIGLALSIMISLALLSFSDSHLTIVGTIDHLFPVSTGCKIYPPKRFWITYVPLLLFHGYLYLLAIYVAFLNRDLWKFSEATRKIFWDGTVTFFVFLVTSLCVIIFSSRTSILWLSIPTTLCPITLIATSITLTRRAIGTRMFLEKKTNVFDSQDTMIHAIEMMPLEAR